jgi:hypothetical protein
MLGKDEELVRDVVNCSGIRFLKNATAVVLSRTETESRLDRRTATGEWAFGSVKTRALYFTSAAVTGLPSCHRARGSIENAIDSESGAHVQLLRKLRSESFVSDRGEARA